VSAFRRTIYHVSVTTLHITNGDCAAGTLRSFLSDRVLVTCDVLHDGPAPLLEPDAWYDIRARFLSDGFGARYDEIRASLAAFDRTVRAAGVDGHSIVLWFEHDLFDQLLLIRTLDVIGGSDSQRRVSLICPGEFPGVQRFIGLGQLNVEQLASLYPTRQPVSDAQFGIAHRAWNAFRASDPTELLSLVHASTTPAEPGALPFLRDAIQRLFEEYPSTHNGLSRSAEAVLRAVAAQPLDAMSLFQATQVDEARPFMGDAGLFDVVHGLANARVPLATITPAATGLDLRGHAVAITDAGREVLSGRADAVALNGIDEWRGGVHLAGVDRSPWRWDRGRETLVS